jgi:hypothetical protein
VVKPAHTESNFIRRLLLDGLSSERDGSRAVVYSLCLVAPVVSFQKGLVFEVWGERGCPSCLLFYHVLYFSLRMLKHKAPAFIGHSFGRRNLLEGGVVIQKKKTRDAQCASAHVAMAAVVSFISIWLPHHERTGLSVSPLARPLLVCIQISILGEQERRKETMAVHFLMPLFHRMVVAGRSYGRGRLGWWGGG